MLDKQFLAKALAGGDLSSLNEEQRGELYLQVCESLKFNPLTSPIGFYSDRHGRLHMSVKASGARQLRVTHNINVTSLVREIIDNVVIYTAGGNLAGGRSEMATGAVSLEGLNGVDKANAFKAAETQAKRRLSLDLAGIGLLDESEVETSPNLTPVEKKPEPTPVQIPQVNNAPATVVKDTRVEIADVTNLTPTELFALPVIPKVTEAMVAAIHAEGDKLNTPQADPHSIVEKARPSMPPVAQGGIFDEEPETLVTTPPPAAPAPVVDAVLAAVSQAEHPSVVPGVEMPVAIPKPVDQPTRLQYQAFTVRCTKLVRDFLPKAGDKKAGDLLLPYLKKTFGVKELNAESTSIKLWEDTLAKLESSTPQAAVKILKGDN